MDDVLSTLFSHFGLDYSSKYRKDYFLIFAIVFLKERVCDNNQISALREYYKFLEDRCIKH